MIISTELVVGFTDEVFTVQEGNDTGLVCISVTEGWLDSGEWAEVNVTAVETNETTGQCTKSLQFFTIQGRIEWLPIFRH